MKKRNYKRILAIVLSLMLLLSAGQLTSLAFAWDKLPAKVAQNTSSELIDIEFTGFKGGRNEYVDIPFGQTIESGKYNYVMDVDMKQLTGYFLVKPVTYDQNATFTINGQACDFNVPYKLAVPSVRVGEAPQDIPCRIVVTSGDGLSTTEYMLTVRTQDLYDKVATKVLEENLPVSGVYQFTSINGFTTAEDCSIFIGQDRAVLFDCLNGGADNARRGGNLKAEIYKILTEKFGITDPDNYPIDVVITHLHGDHIGMLQSSTPAAMRLYQRGAGNGTVYWPLNDGSSASTVINDPNTDVKMVIDGDKITGPDFGNGPLVFDCLEVPTHTNGSTMYLMDNEANHNQCERNYLVLGDAIGSGSYVFNHGSSTLAPIFNRAMQKSWDAVKGFDELYCLAGHSWQERVSAAERAGVSYVEDMYVASSIVLDNPFIGAFDTTSNTAYARKLSYGTAGYWYNDAAVYDFRDGELLKDKITPTHLLRLDLMGVTPSANKVSGFNPLTTMYNVTHTTGEPLYLFNEAFDPDANIAVTLNGAAVAPGDALDRGDRGYKLNIVPSDNAALAGAGGINVVKITVTNGNNAAVDYTINVRTINDNTLYPLPSATAYTYTISAKPAVSNAANALYDVKISSFKGGRLEPYRITLDNPIVPAGVPFNSSMFDNKNLTATMDWGSRTSNVVYISPVPVAPGSAAVPTPYTVNGVASEFPLPYRAVLTQGANVFTIGVGTSTYTLTINAVPLWDQYVKEEIEPGVFRIQDAKGFVTNDDMYLFVGEDKAMLFDTGMGEGDLLGFVRSIVGSTLPIEVVITHSHGDHYGKVEQFRGCKVYWPEKDAAGIPSSYDVSRYVYVQDGQTLVGPKFGGSAITWEAVEVPGHTGGSMLYLYDNKVQQKLDNSYLVTGDAIGSGSYVFNFGSGKPAVSTFARAMRKLEAKIAKFTDGFYDASQKVTYNDVSGLYFLCGHSWQETANMQPIYGPMWDEPMPLQTLAGIQMVRDMRIAAEKVVSGSWQGKLRSRNAGGVVQELRQLTYRQAGLWYNGWDVVRREFATAQTGETVIVPITLRDAESFAGVTGRIDYDSELLTLQAITAKKDFMFVSDGNRFVCVSPNGAALSGDVVIGYAIFSVRAELTDDVTTSVIFEALEGYDDEGQDNQVLLAPVEISVLGITPQAGDVNLDGKVDVADAILLMQYLAGSKTLTARQLRAADANKDSKVNVGDVTIIMQMCL